MRDLYLESTAKAVVNFVNTETYAEGTGSLVRSYLDVAEPLRAWMDQITPHVLAYYGLPSRYEVLSVASRMKNIEFRLDDMEAALHEIGELLRKNRDFGAAEQKAA